MAGERAETACPEFFDTRLHEVYFYNIESKRFKRVLTQDGALSLPKLHEPIPSDPEPIKPLLFKIKNPQGRFSYYKPLGPEDILLKRVMKSCFSRQKPWLDFDDVILVTPFPSQGPIYDYQIIPAETLIQAHKKLLKERNEIIERIKSTDYSKIKH